MSKKGGGGGGDETKRNVSRPKLSFSFSKFEISLADVGRQSVFESLSGTNFWLGITKI